jgi:hypothetical protein
MSESDELSRIAVKPALDSLALRKRPSRLRFRLGEGYTVGPNGADQYLGEVLR